MLHVLFRCLFAAMLSLFIATARRCHAFYIIDAMLRAIDFIHYADAIISDAALRFRRTRRQLDMPLRLR